MARLIVKEIATSKGFDFMKLKQATKVAYSTLIRYWVGDVKNVSLDALEKIAFVLRVNMGTLISEESPLELSGEEKEEMFMLNQDARVRANLQRATEAGTDATLTFIQWLNILDHFDRKCAYCQGEYEVLEHIISVSQHGGTTATNCVPACYRCNTLKMTSYSNMPKETIEGVLAKLRSIF